MRLGRGAKEGRPSGSSLASATACSPDSEGSLVGSEVVEEESSVVDFREGRVIIWLMMGFGLGWVKVKGSSKVRSLRGGGGGRVKGEGRRRHPLIGAPF